MNRPALFLLFILSSSVLYGRYLGDGKASQNVVGMECRTVHKGIQTITNTFTAVSAGHGMTLGDILKSAEQYDEIWFTNADGEIALRVAADFDSKNKLHWYDLKNGDVADNLLLESYQRIFEYRRRCDKTTTLELTGEVSERRIEPDVKLSSRHMNDVIRLNDLKIDFPIIPRRPFQLVMRNGKRLDAMVDPSTRLVVDPKSGIPLQVEFNEIVGADVLPPSAKSVIEKAIGEKVEPLPKVEVEKAAKEINEKGKEKEEDRFFDEMWMYVTGGNFTTKGKCRALWMLVLGLMFLKILDKVIDSLLNKSIWMVRRFCNLIGCAALALRRKHGKRKRSLLR